MNKSILKSLVLIAVLAIVISCNNEKKADITNLVGKWERTDVDTISLVIEITNENGWKYYKDNELLEKGKLEVTAEQFIMKHDVEEHSHDDGKQGHDHHHPEDHIYKYSLNEDQTELSIISEKKTTVYKKIK